MGHLTKENQDKVVAHIRALGGQLEFLRPDGVGLTQDGANETAKYALAHFDQQGSIDVMQLGKYVEQVKKLYPQYRTDIPHLDEFPECYTVEKATVYIKKNSRKIAANQINKLNQLLKFLQENDIHSTETAIEETPEQVEQRETYAAVRERVSALTNRDCGNVYSTPGGGAWDKVNALKRRLFAYVDACAQRNVPAAMVAERVNADIENFRSTSIR
jgi:hypothetical protein